MKPANSQFRNSKQRQRVLETVAHAGFHPTADWVYQRIRLEDPNISLGTVYRNLDVLCQMGKIGRVGVGDGPEAFDANPMPHYHLICRECGRVEDMPMSYMPELDRQARQAGFNVTGHRILFEGLCQECAKRTCQ